MRLTSRLLLVASLALGVAGCVTAPPIVAAASQCSELLPAEWEQGVEGATVPADAPPEPADLPGKLAHALDQLKAWAGFAVEESARREMANGRTKDSIGIVRRCEERDRKAVQSAGRRFLGLF